MSRRRKAEKRIILKDPIYKDLVVAKFINYLMKDVDVIACPSTARSAYPVTPAELYSSPKRDPWLSRFTVPTDYAGLPTISLPSGINKKGLPLSIQFIGHFLAEPTLIRIGSAYERFTNFTNLHPPL